MKHKINDIIFLNPVFTHNIWGGTRLRDDFKYEVEGSDIGECWGIAAHPNGDSMVRDGELAGKKLSEVWKTYPELFGRIDTSEEVFPLLVKIIDAKDDLSIQVHPDDEYAKVNENGSLGKMECWYILDCKEDATLVIGHNAGSKDELQNMIYNGQWTQLIQEIPVHKGDFIQINPGTVHAIKGGIMLLETQQNSDITYRVYDYDRLSNGKPRELHIEKSIDVITTPAETVEECVKTNMLIPTNQLNLLYACEYYEVYKLEISGIYEQMNSFPYLLMSVVEGEGRINGQKIAKGDHFIITSECDVICLEGDLEIICSTGARR